MKLNQLITAVLVGTVATASFTASAKTTTQSTEVTSRINKDDVGPQPNAFDIAQESDSNENYRKVAWTGKDLQVTLMSIEPGKDIGLEMHPQTDQFIRIESGEGQLEMGSSKNNLNFKKDMKDGWVMVAPAGTWYNIKNTGDQPLKLYAIYAPVHHAKGIIQPTKEQADKDGKTGKDKAPKLDHSAKT